MGGLQIRASINWLRSWVAGAKNEQAENEGDLCPLPPLWAAHVRRRSQQLPIPEAQVTSMAQQLTEAIVAWQRDPEAPNNLVLFSKPVETTDALLEAVLSGELPEGVEVHHPLPWRHRPDQIHSITDQLQQALDNLQNPGEEDLSQDDLDDPDVLAQRRVVIVVPPLEQCFLRCIGGWQGIEWLRDTIGQQPQYFWLIRCNTWTWGFLDRVCQVGAYFTCHGHLPALEDSQLASWLAPLARSLQGSANPPNQGDSPENGKANQPDFEDWDWRTLAELSMGSAPVALDLWRQSLRIRQADRPTDEVPTVEDNAPLPVPLQQLAPTLPGLPDLEAEDHYVIHALMLHGPMSRSHLALALGQNESQVQVQMQRLQQAGLIQRDRHGLAIAPAHYPKLCAQLSNNNFLTGEV
jgi:hypothetical protein